MTLAEVRDFSKTFKIFSNYYIGRIDTTKTNILGVYGLNAMPRHKCMGNAQKCEIRGISFLVHGSTNKDNTEKLANKFYEALENCESGSIGGKKINMITFMQDAPVDVDVSDNKIYEYVIEVIFYVDKEE